MRAWPASGAHRACERHGTRPSSYRAFVSVLLTFQTIVGGGVVWTWPARDVEDEGAEPEVGECVSNGGLDFRVRRLEVF